MLLRNVAWLSADYKALYPNRRTLHSSCCSQEPDAEPLSVVKQIHTEPPSHFSKNPPASFQALLYHVSFSVPCKAPLRGAIQRFPKYINHNYYILLGSYCALSPSE
jgi:hypothetical protein